MISVTDQSGKAITSATHIGNLNPFRYRGYYYDSETGFYYLMSRYYDPFTHRFINADGYFQSGNDILDANMSVYCGNNPINRSDPIGLFWKEIGNFFKKVGQSIYNAFTKTFGASASVVNTHTSEVKEHVPLPFSLLVTAKTGNKTTSTETKAGNSSTLCNAYAQGRSDNYLLSSVGLRTSNGISSTAISIGLDNIGFSTSINLNNRTDSLAFKVNITELKVGLEVSSETKLGEHLTSTDFTNISVTGLGIIHAYQFSQTGEWDLSLQTAN